MPLNFPRCSVQSSDYVFRVLQKADACRGKSHRPGGAVQKLGSKLLLQRMDLPGYRGLGNVQNFCRSGKIQIFCNLDKTL